MQITRRDIQRFTMGDCHYLARALCKLDSDLEMVSFNDGKVATIHCFVKTPNGLYLDIHGLQDEGTIMARWQEMRPHRMHEQIVIKPVGWYRVRYTWNWGTGHYPKFGNYTYTRAKQMAQFLYERNVNV